MSIKHISEFFNSFFNYNKDQQKKNLNYFASQELNTINHEIEELQIKREKMEKIYINTLDDNTCHI